MAIGLAACSDAEHTSARSESAESASPSPEPVLDSDGDGTVAAHDYAPKDPAVQRVEDVRPTAPSTTPASPQPSDPAPAAPVQPATALVPDVTGMDYQAAQDLLRANGLVVMPATDGLGANRLPVIDSNWYLVSQDLQPGSTVDAGTAITCTILKYTDR